MKFSLSGVGRQHRNAREDLIALLLYGFSNKVIINTTYPMF